MHALLRIFTVETVHSSRSTQIWNKAVQTLHWQGYTWNLNIYAAKKADAGAPIPTNVASKLKMVTIHFNKADIESLKP